MLCFAGIFYGCRVGGKVRFGPRTLYEEGNNDHIICNDIAIIDNVLMKRQMPILNTNNANAQKYTQVLMKRNYKAQSS